MLPLPGPRLLPPACHWTPQSRPPPAGSACPHPCRPSRTRSSARASTRRRLWRRTRRRAACAPRSTWGIPLGTPSRRARVRPRTAARCSCRRALRMGAMGAHVHACAGTAVCLCCGEFAGWATDHRLTPPNCPAAGYGAWLHGEAVAAGTMMAADMSQRLGWIEPALVQRIRALNEAAKLPVAPPPVSACCEGAAAGRGWGVSAQMRVASGPCQAGQPAPAAPQPRPPHGLLNQSSFVVHHGCRT